MQHIPNKILILISFLLLSINTPIASVFAASAPVKFTIPNTSLTIKGFASPHSFVEIQDGPAVIGTAAADSNGVFEKIFPSMDSGLHNVKIIYTDTNGLKSDPLSQTINVRSQSDTAIEYFLPPTVIVNPISPVEGELATFSGSSIPNANIEILLDGGNIIFRPQTDVTGQYSISADTTGYYFGEHNIAAQAKQGGLTSLASLSKPFIIVPVSSGQNANLPKTLDPPIIISNAGSVEAKEQTQIIRGTAPPNIQIIILLDGEPIGSTFSNASGGWFFNVALSNPKHDVRALSCIDNSCSDFSNLVTITYDQNFDQCSSFRVWLEEYRFWGIAKGSGIDLNLTGVSGEPPYEVSIDWGDSVTERFNRNSAQSYKIHHIYEEMGQYSGNLTIRDDSGCQYSRYFSVNITGSELNMVITGLIGLIAISALYLLRKRYQNRVKRVKLAR